MSRHKPELSREKIAATAIAMADADGFEAVTMRRLASEMGVGTMSLYHYVKTKEELVSMMDDALMADVILASLPTDWRRALCEIATRTHKVLVSHSWVFSSILSASPGLNAMRHMEQCLQALDGTSLTDQQKLTLLAMVDDFVFGSALRDVLSTAPMRAQARIALSKVCARCCMRQGRRSSRVSGSVTAQCPFNFRFGSGTAAWLA